MLTAALVAVTGDIYGISALKILFWSLLGAAMATAGLLSWMAFEVIREDERPQNVDQIRGVVL